MNENNNPKINHIETKNVVYNKKMNKTNKGIKHIIGNLFNKQHIALTIVSFVLLVSVITNIVLAVNIANLGRIFPQANSNNDTLYNWILENGELVNGTDLIYKNGGFTLYTNISRKMYVEYIIPNHNGYTVTVRLPLFEKEVTSEFTVQNETSSSLVFCTHYPENFTLKTPLEYKISSEIPDFDYIDRSKYGTTKYEDGKMVFYLDENKREEYEKKLQYNNEISDKRKERENIAKEISHRAISDILDWLKSETNMDAIDLGYIQYKNN